MFASHTAVRILLLVVAILALWALFASDSDASGPAQRYTVEPGDTLWSIATAHHAGDPREGVWEIRRRNHLDSATIVPGQVLVIPS
jgi:LysM repeat protein